MRVNEKTIKLAKIRRHIRNAIQWHKVDEGMPEPYTSDNYKTSKLITDGTGIAKGFYYIKSERAIKEIAEKIYDLVKEEPKGYNLVWRCSKCNTRMKWVGDIRGHWKCSKCGHEDHPSFCDWL